MEARMNQLTLRHIPAPVEHRLRVQARKSGQSLNKTAISLLAKAVGLQGNEGSKRKRDLSRFAGTMSSDEVAEFERNTRQFEAIDDEVWEQ